MTARVCVTVPIPSFQSLYAAIRDALPDIHSFELPPLIAPILPNPIYPGFSIPSMEIMESIKGLQTFQLLTVIKIITKPVVDILGLALDFLGTIPGTAIGIVELLAGDAAALYQSIAAAIQQGASFPIALPSPLFSDVSMPAVEIPKMAIVIITGFITTALQKLFDLCSMILDFARHVIDDMHLNIALPELPTLPSIPSWDDVKNLFSSLGENQHWPTIPGFPAGIVTPSIPDPIIPHIQSPSISIVDKIGIMFSNMSSFILQLLMDFLKKLEEKVGQYIGLTLPSIPMPCIDFV
jgi:hypothetical protein